MVYMNALDTTLLLLSSAVLGVVAIRFLNLPPMLGYLAVGIVIGPYGMGWAKESASTQQLAELGVVFLMFSIGLEFSLQKLLSMRKAVFGLGFVQVAATIVLAMLGIQLAAWVLPQYFAMDWRASLALGGALAMSSTAIVSKMLSEKLELESAHGRQIISVLLFQDLAVVPLLILVPAFASNSDHLGQALAVAGGKAILMLSLLFVLGKRFVRMWFAMVVKRRSQELFMLNLLLFTLGAAWLTEKAGLSLALGAFVAGMLISETEYKHQVEEDIKSFRDVLLGLFFVSIGMLLNVGLLLEFGWLIVLLLIVPVLVKFALIFGLARLFSCPTGVALRTGLGLAQAGEFGFVLLNQAGALNMIDPLLLQLILASMVLSMLASPFILAKSDAIALQFSSTEWMLQSLALTQIAARTMQTKRHVIIAGFGRSGQNLAHLLSEEKIDYHALDLDPDRIREAQIAGANVSYGDAGRRESLTAVGIHRAAALVITYNNTPSALKILRLAHELNPSLPVIVRSHDDSDLERLRAAGATEVVPDLMEGSLMLASHALVMLGVPLRRVLHTVQTARDARYSALRGFFHGVSDAVDNTEHLQIRLHSVVIEEGVSVVEQTLESIELSQFEVDVSSLRRGKNRLDPVATLIIQVGDVIVLRGTAEGVARAESRLHQR